MTPDTPAALAGMDAVVRDSDRDEMAGLPSPSEAVPLLEKVAARAGRHDSTDTLPRPNSMPLEMVPTERARG